MENNNKRFRLQGKVGYHREFGNVLPNKIIYMSVEGAKTEYSYFSNLGNLLSKVQNAPILKLEVLARKDHGSDPEHVLGLLQEYLDLQQEGLIPAKLKDEFSKIGVTDKDIEKYLDDTSSLESEKRALIEEKIDYYELDLSYRRYLRLFGKHENDRYVVVIDRDYKSHTMKAIQDCMAFIQNSDVCIELYISNPSFDLWLLLHSQAGYEYLFKADPAVIKENAKISLKHTELSSHVADFFHHGKHISFEKFKAEYWPNIRFAIESSKDYTHDNKYLLDNIGTNIAQFFTDDIKKVLPCP